MIFKPNPLMQAELEEEGLYGSMLKGKAEDVKREAENIAPQGETGDYASSFVLVEEDKHWVVGNKDFAAHLVEWGSVNNPPYAVLRRAAQAVGLHWDEAPKP